MANDGQLYQAFLDKISRLYDELRVYQDRSIPCSIDGCLTLIDELQRQLRTMEWGHD